MGLFDALLLEGVRVNFWVAARTDGLAGSGSQADPFNAAEGRLDDVMVKILSLAEAQTAPISVHLGPGVFETNGYRSDNETSPSGWQPKAGMKLLGAGIEVTTLKLVNCPSLQIACIDLGVERGNTSLKRKKCYHDRNA